MCYYDIALGKQVSVTVLNKLESAYVNCLKIFTFHKYSSVTNVLVQLRLPRPTFDTVCHNADWSFSSCVADLCT